MQQDGGAEQRRRNPGPPPGSTQALPWRGSSDPIATHAAPWPMECRVATTASLLRAVATSAPSLGPHPTRLGQGESRPWHPAPRDLGLLSRAMLDFAPRADGSRRTRGPRRRTRRGQRWRYPVSVGASRRAPPHLRSARWPAIKPVASPTPPDRSCRQSWTWRPSSNDELERPTVRSA